MLYDLIIPSIHLAASVAYLTPVGPEWSSSIILYPHLHFDYQMPAFSLSKCLLHTLFLILDT